MRPLSWAERRPNDATVSMAQLLTGEGGHLAGESDARLADYTDEILASGFPGLRDLSPRPRTLQLDSYVTRIVQRELVDAGLQVRRPDALRAWLTAYAAATSTDASYATILDAATPGVAEKPARATVDTYREHLTRLYVLDPLPAWTPAFNPIKRLTLSAKHHLVDRRSPPASSGWDAPDSSRGREAGLRRDGLVARGPLRIARRTECPGLRRRRHCARLPSAHQADRSRGRPGRRGRRPTRLAIEVKLSESVTDHDVRHLNWLQQQLGDLVVDRVVITTGKTAYRRRDGVAVIPFALLGP